MSDVRKLVIDGAELTSIRGLGYALARLALLRAHGESEDAFGRAHAKEARLWRRRACSTVAAE